MKQEKAPQPASTAHATPNSTSKVKTFRVCDKTSDMIHDTQKSLGTTMDETFRIMVNNFTLTKAQESLPERASEIREVEMLCRRLISAYTHSLLLCHDADARAEESMKTKMSKLEQMISQQSDTLVQTNKKLQFLTEENRKLQEELQQVKAERDALRKSYDTDNKLATRLDALQEQLTSLIPPAPSPLVLQKTI